jgi:MFS family permease
VQLTHRYLAGFMAIGILAGVSNGIAKVALPLYAASLHASAWQIGLVGGLQFVGVILLSLPIGALIDRVGSRALFRFGGFGGALLYLLAFPYFSAPWQLILGVVAFGLVNPFRMVPTQTEFLGLLPRLGLGKAGWHRASHSLGMFFLGPLAGAAMIAWLGFADTFRLVAAGLLVTLLIGNHVLSVAAPGRGGEAMPLSRRIREQFAIVASRAELRQSMLIEFFGQAAVSYFNVFIVLIAIRQFGVSAQTAASLISLQGALFVLTLLVGGALLTALKESERYAIAFGLLCVAELVLSAPPSLVWLWIGAAFLGLGVGTQHLTSVGRFASLASELGKGRVGGMFSLAGPAGGVVGAIVGGILNQYLGLFAGFRAMAVLYCLLLCWIAWRFTRRDRGRSSQHALSQPEQGAKI